jgi:hypothetical protein
MHADDREGSRKRRGSPREPNALARRYWAEIFAGVPADDGGEDRRRRRARAVRMRTTVRSHPAGGR